MYLLPYIGVKNFRLLQEKNRALTGVGNKVVRKTFSSKKTKVIRGYRKVHTVKLHTCHCSTDSNMASVSTRKLSLEKLAQRADIFVSNLKMSHLGALGIFNKDNIKMSLQKCVNVDCT